MRRGDADAMSLAAGLVSWAVGVAFGRFDIRLATSARVQPEEPEPFEPLPVCSPGMRLPMNMGLPIVQFPLVDIPLKFRKSVILVDDHGHAHDIATAVRSIFDEVFKANAETGGGTKCSPS